MPINRFSKEYLEAWGLRYFEPVQSSPKKAGRHGPPSHYSAHCSVRISGDRQDMNARTKLRFIGGAILLFNLWLVGRYSIEGLPVLLLTFGFAIGYEYVVVRRAKEEITHDND